MPIQAPLVQYDAEFIAAFEQRESLLRGCVINKGVVKGNSFIFGVSGSNGGVAVTRGANGLIPATINQQTQYTCTLAEWHRLEKQTGFVDFASQGDQRAAMQKSVMAVLNRKIDEDIIGALDSSTLFTDAAHLPLSFQMIQKAIVLLGNAEVSVQETDNMFGLLTPAAMAYLMQLPEFSNAQYVDTKPFTGKIGQMYRWYGINWMQHPNLTGVGTASEKCYLFHRNAIGSAVNVAGVKNAIGNDEEQDMAFVRSSIYMGSKLIQNTGIIQLRHDGSALSS